MKRLLALLIPFAIWGGGAEAQDAKAPWQLTFRHGPLDVITVHYKNGDAKSFMYIRFTLENKSSSTALLSGLHFKAVVGTDKRKRKTHIAVPEAAAEETVRRLSRVSDLKNVQQIHKHNGGKLEPGQTIRGIAVLGVWSREWDVATISVSGLESGSMHCRVRKFGDSGYTVSHRAYYHWNRRVLEKVTDVTDFTEARAIVKHDVVWNMVYTRSGDEFAPQMDELVLETEGWDVASSSVAMEKKPRFGE